MLLFMAKKGRKSWVNTPPTSEVNPPVETRQALLLVIVIILIAGGFWYLSSQRPQEEENPGIEITLPGGNENNGGDNNSGE
jgi:hypothetical protein